MAKKTGAFLICCLILSSFIVSSFAQADESSRIAGRLANGSITIRPPVDAVNDSNIGNHAMYLWALCNNTSKLYTFQIVCVNSMKENEPWPTLKNDTAKPLVVDIRLDLPDGFYTTWITHGGNGQNSTTSSMRVARGWGDYNTDIFTPNDQRPWENNFTFFVNPRVAQKDQSIVDSGLQVRPAAGYEVPGVGDIIDNHNNNHNNGDGDGSGDRPTEREKIDLGFTPGPIQYTTTWRGEEIVISYPAGEDSVWNENFDDNPELFIPGADLEVRQERESMINRMMTGAVETFAASMWVMFGLHDPVTLFFSICPVAIHSSPANAIEELDPEMLASSLYVNPETAFLYMFSEDEEAMIKGIFGILGDYLIIPYSLLVIIIGGFMILRNTSSEDRATSKVLIVGLFLFPLLLRFVPYLFEPLFWLNDTIVRALGSYLIAHPLLGAEGEAVLARPFVTILISSGTNIGFIGAAAASLVLVIMSGILNLQYFVRRFMLALLVMIFPIVAFMQIYPGTRHTLQLWWSEFGANLFLQSAHAMVYVLFVHYVYVAQLPIIPVFAMMTTLSSMTLFIRSLMGVQQSSGVAGMMGGMMGVGSIMGAMKIFGGIARGVGKGASSVVTESPSGSSGGPSSPASAGGGSGGGGGGSGVSSARGGSTGNLGMLPARSNSDTETSKSQPLSVNADDLSDKPGKKKNNNDDDKKKKREEEEEMDKNRKDDKNFGEAPDSNTGPVWGAKPRVQPKRIGQMAANVAAKTAMGVGAFTGAYLGGAAMGPAGIGVGAMVGTKVTGMGVEAADNVAGSIGGSVAKKRIVDDVMRKNPEMFPITGNSDLDRDARQRATVYAATGVNATPAEVGYDDAMRRQYINFNDNFGYQHAIEDMALQSNHALSNMMNRYANDSSLAQRLSNKIDIRNKAAQERESFIRQNPQASLAESNQHVLNETIRPRLAALQQNMNRGSDSGGGGVRFKPPSK